MRHLIIAVATLVAITCASRVASAYPQYQLSKDQTCSSCHLSPAGGGLLSENGLNTAEAFSQYGTAPEFFYNKLGTPSWLTLGGDLRGAVGYFKTPDNQVDPIPMQAEVYVHAAYKGFSAQFTGGVRDPQNDNVAATILWSREHYLMWQSDPGSADGVFVRVGRFMPVFGLRFAEHEDYTRRYGGTQLYSETYGAAAEIIEPKWEAHLTGFIKDPLIDTTDHSNGVAFYGETRPVKRFSVGAEAMYKSTDDDNRTYYGLTAKLLPIDQLLLQGEIEGERDNINGGGSTNQIIGYLMASVFVGKAGMVDVGWGHYDEDVAVSGLKRDAFDINIHWFTTSHLELALDSRIEHEVGPTGAYSLLMLHYRL